MPCVPTATGLGKDTYIWEAGQKGGLGSGREQLWDRRYWYLAGAMRFFVLSLFNLFSPDVRRTNLNSVNGNSSAVLLTFSVSTALLTSMNFKTHA